MDVQNPFGNGPGSLQTPVPNPPTPMPPVPSPSTSQGAPTSSDGVMEMGPIQIQPGSPSPTPEPNAGSPQGSPQGEGSGERGPSSLTPQEQAILDGTTPQAVQAYSRPPSVNLLPFAGGPPGEIARQMSLGRTPDQQSAILNKLLGAGNSIVDNGDVYWRRTGESSFRPVNAQLADGIANLYKGVTGHFDFSAIKDIAESLTPSGIASEYNTNYQNLLEFAHQLSAGTTGGIGGAAAGAAMTPEIGGSGGFVGGYLGEQAATDSMAYWDSVQRSNAINKILDDKLIPGKQTVDVGAQASSDLGTTAAIMAGAPIALAGVSKIADYLSGLSASTTANRWIRANNVKDALVRFVEPLKAGSLNEIAEGWNGLLNSLSSPKVLYDRFLSKWDQQAQSYLDQTGQQVDVSPVLAKIKDMTGRWVRWKGNTPLPMNEANSHMVGSDGFSDVLNSMSQEQLQRANEASGAMPSSMPGPELLAEIYNASKPFSSDQGWTWINDLLKEHSALSSLQTGNGGLPYQIFKERQIALGKTITNWSRLDPKLYPKGDDAIYSDLYGSYIDARTALMNQVFSGDQGKLAAYNQDLANYGMGIKSSNLLHDTFGKNSMVTGDAVSLAMKTNDPKVIQSIKFLFGEDKEIGTELKSAVIQNLMTDSLASKNINMILDPQALVRTWNSYDPKVLSEVFSPQEMQQMRKTMNLANRLSISDMLSPVDKQTAMDLTRLAFSGAGGSVNPYIGARFAYGVAQGNPKVLNYIETRALPGLLDEAKLGNNFGLFNYLSAGLQKLTDYRFLSDVIDTGTRRKLVPSNALRQAFIQVGADMTRRGLPSPAKSQDDTLH